MGETEDEISRILRIVVDNLRYAEQKLTDKYISSTDLSSSNGKLTAVLNLNGGFYDNVQITLTFSAGKQGPRSFGIGSCPVAEFQSVLSLITPLRRSLAFFAEQTRFVTKTIIKNAIQDLDLCEKILTVREELTNNESYPDWAEAVQDKFQDLDEDVFVSVFPFRDSLYVTAYEAKETDEPLCEIHRTPLPFDPAPKSVVKIGEKHYLIKHSMVARQEQDFLWQTVRWIRQSILLLEYLDIGKKRQSSA